MSKANHYYILEGRETRAVPYDEWIDQFQTFKRHKIIKQQTMGEYLVSTVFLGINHAWEPDREPLIFETMVFDRDNRDIMMDRCSTYEQAEQMHWNHMKIAAYADRQGKNIKPE